MPKLEFTTEELKGYFKEKVTHHFYGESVKNADRLKVHADGIFPGDLIKDRRPNEPEEVLAYREKIFIAKTKPTFSKVISSLSKIRRSADWSIRYPEDSTRFGKVLFEESLQNYCDKKFPYFDSVTNWVFSVLLKKYLVDPMSVVFTFPLEVNIEENQYLRPYPVIFESSHVLTYVHEDYAVLTNPLGAYYQAKKERVKGDSFYIVTTERIQRYDQVNSKGDINLALDFEHELGFLPVFRIGAIVAKADGNNYLHESRIASMLPELDEALREYSDLQAAKVLHIYPERWEFTQNECTRCKGTTKIRNPKWFNGCGDEVPAELDCDNRNCSNGYVAAGPYSKIMVRPANSIEGMPTIPTPPAGYVEKDVEIVKVQDEGVDKHIFNALAAINFQFLEQTPLNQSGTAKEVDKDELNNTVHSIAEDLVRVMDVVYKTMAVYRYKKLYSPDDIIQYMVPVINVPEKFDILSSSHLEEELSKAKTNKINPILQNALEQEYATKKFNADPTIAAELMLVLKLDPLPNISEDEKMSRLSNKGIIQETYIISSNIHEFVQQALDEDKDFADRTLKEQKDKMRQYAKSQLSEQESAKKIVASVLQDTELAAVSNQEEVMEVD